MSTETMEFRLRAIMDVNDVVSNVGTIQKSFNKLKLPDKIGDNLNKKVSEFYKEYEKYQKKTAEGIKTQGDYNQVEKSLNRMKTLYQEIGKEAKKATKLDIDSLIDLGTGDFKRISDEISKMVQQINNVKIDPKQLTQPFQEIKRATQNKKIVGDDGLLNQIIGHINEGEIDKAKNKLKELQNYAQKVSPRTVLTTNKETGEKEEIRAPGTMDAAKYETLTNAINLIATAFDKADNEAAPFIAQLDKLQKELQETKNAANQDLLGDVSKFNEESKNVEKVTDSLKRMHEEEFNFNRQAQDIDRQIQSYFGLSQMIRKVGDIARDAFNTVKELDAAMTETAVVTNFSVGDMWTMLPTYTEQANQLGSTIKDVYEAATLYYQQGLNTNQAMGLANETLKMARIAGLDAAEATNMMTAALRGFNMEINQTSAQKINDIYSELAAITASDTKEIGSAMERTASIANSANMDFATTSAFLAQMIETTREAPENLGTAMKTIVARFQEMKKDPTKLIDSEGVAMDVNKVDVALKSIGVNLTNTKGEFRDLDDVFLDISSKWDSLTQGQQRYIATIAAGSRQQSRFIAMMSNYDRTMELVDAANNSAGASQKQFEKTLDSMASKLNQLKNAWDQFTMGLMNNQIIKFGVDALTDGLTVINKLIDLLGKIPPSPFEGITKSALTLGTTLLGLNLGKKLARGGVMAGVGWWKGEGTFGENFKNGFGPGTSSNKKVEEKDFQKQAQESLLKKYNSKLVSNEAKLKVPIGAEAYLQKIDASKLDSRIKQKIEDELGDGPITVDKQVKINSIIKQDANYNKDLDITDDLVKSEEGIDNFGNKFDGLTSKITNTGMALQQFGSTMKSPLGDVLSTVGSLMVGLGTSLEATAVSFNKNIALGMTDAGVKTADATATTLLGNAQLTTAVKAQILGKALWASLGPLAAIALAIGVAVVAYKLLDSAIVTNKEKLENATDAAAKAADAFDSAKQETSELADSIEQIKSNENAFDGLVAGTAEFNEQLVEANRKITELISKYPELSDPKYLSTDENGLMHITQAGLDYVKDYQKQRQSNAAALSTLQTAQLKTEENRQEAQRLKNGNIFSTETSESFKKRLQEAEYLEQSAKAAEEVAIQTAITTSLSDKEIKNREQIAKLYSSQYNDLVKQVDTSKMGIDEMRQAYADFYGYTYNKSKKEIVDPDGTVVATKDDDQVIKDAIPDITVMTNLQLNAASLDDMLDDIDKKFSGGLGDAFKGTELSLGKILSNNIEVDEDKLKELLADPGKIVEGIKELDEAEIAAILNAKIEDVQADPEKFTNQLVKLTETRAKNIVEAQSAQDKELASMLAQSTANGRSAEEILADESTLNAIKQQIDNLTASQKNTLVKVGKTLQENVGTEAMKTFVDGMQEIYASGNIKLVDEAQNIVDDINWESPTDRLRGYNEMINMTEKGHKKLGKEGVASINEIGQSLKDSTDEANLLGEAFSEFYTSTEWQKLSENMDKFVDSSGQITSSSVLEMAEECSTLANLLDTDAISAGGVAAALNAMGGDGDIVLDNLNSRVLTLLSSFSELEGVMASAHKTVEAFDPGVDTGEGEDFIKDAVEKWKSFYENGEYGNSQLENYTKLIVGEERWTKALKKNNGDREATLKHFSKKVNKFADGYYEAWKGIADKTGGKKIDGISANLTDSGKIELDVGDKTTEQVVQWVKDVYKVSDEVAELMVTDFQNYSADFKTALSQNDFKAGLKDADYIDSRLGTNGKLAITQSELDTIMASTGKTMKEIKETFAEAGYEIEKIKNTKEDGTYEDNYSLLNKRLSETKGSKFKNAWLSDFEYNGEKGTIDLNNAINYAIERGFTKTQAQGMAFESYKNAEKQGKQYYYNGELIKPGQFKDLDDFVEHISKIDQNSQWVEVGKAICDGYFQRLDERNNKPTPEPDEDGSSKDTGDNNQDKGGSVDQSDIWDKEKENVKGSLEEFKGLFFDRLKELSDFFGVDTSNEILMQTQQAYGEAIANAEIDTSAAEEKGEEFIGKNSDAFNNGIENGDPRNKPPKTPGASNSGEEQNTGGKTSTVAVEVKGKEQLDAVKQEIDSIPAQKTSNITITQNYETTGSEISASDQTTSIKYTLKDSDQAKPTPQETAVKYTLKDKDQAKPKAKDATVNYKLGTQEGPKTNNVTLWATIRDKKSGKIVGLSTAQGKNNTIPNASLPTFGSAARGRYGTLGPKGKGGLTLTGEKGFEIAWLPNENRSMVLGVGGPQMVNLPKDAVVYTHEQSKEIVKRKGIPAGSHVKTSAYGGKTTTTNNNSNSSSGGGNKGNKNDKTKKKEEENAKKAKKINNWWENIARKTEQLQRTADKNQKIWEKYLKKLQATLKKTGTEGQGNAFIKNLNKVIDLNRQQANKASERLNKLDKGNSKLSISYKKGKKTKKESVNVSKYIKIDKESGEYIIDDNALNKDFKKGNKRKAINEALNKELDENISKRNNAEDKIAAAQEALENFSEELYQTFFAWENELTTIWELTKQIEGITGKTSRLESFYNLLNAQISSGMEVASKEMNQSIADTFRKQMDFQVKEIQTRGKLIEEQRADILSLLSTKDEQTTLNSVNKKLKENLSETEKSDYKEYAEELKNQINAIKKAQEYLNITKYADGTIDIDFNQQKLEKDKLNGEISTELYNSIKEYTEKLTDANSELNSSLTELTDNITNLYTSLEDLRNNYADTAEDLVSNLESSNSKQINNLKQISSSLSNALKKLTDEVRKNLDRRRQEEDNVKTEQDINRKQQRLAALRADTSGGHQVEIAQLEKEIADAQESYQRTLEDQLLDKIQQQADEAAEQRERQIALQEAINTSVNNIAQVNAWLTALQNENLSDEERQAILEEIRQVMLDAGDYNNKTIWGQQQLIAKNEKLISALSTFSKEEKAILDAIEKTESEREEVAESNESSDKEKQISDGLLELPDLLAKKITPIVTNPKSSDKVNKDELNNAKQNYLQNKDKKTGIHAVGNSDADKYYDFLFKRGNKYDTGDKNWGKIGKDAYTTMVNRGAKLGYSEYDVAKDLANTSALTWKEVLTAAKKAGKTGKEVKAWNKNAKKGSNFREAFEKVFGKWEKFASGGLAKHTGPAWLDGTPSKPELVLNAQDTKNLIALKDVLSHVMHSSNSTENTYGDTTFEININVDKLTSDYDVDKVAERVKKIIVQDSGYRNVTAVRKFR